MRLIPLKRNRTETDPESDPEAQSVAQPETDSEAQSKVQPEVQSETQPEAQSESRDHEPVADRDADLHAAAARVAAAASARPASGEARAPRPARPDGLRAGTVSFWHLPRNYGFIQPDEPGESSVWVSSEVIDDSFGESFAHLAKGERVLYEATQRGITPDAPPRQQAVRVLPETERRRGIVSQYSFMHGYGTIEGDDGQRYFLHHANLLGEGYIDAEVGSEVFFLAPEDGDSDPGPGLNRGPNRDPIAHAVKLADPRSALQRFAQFPYDLELWLGPLARKATSENWDYKHELSHKRDSHQILRHYLEQTFHRLTVERGLGRATIVEGERAGGRRYAAFNTGLVDDLQKSIYCLFEDHRMKQDSRAWWWRGFYTEDDSAMRPVAELPTPANYLEDPAALIITPDEIRDIRVDSRHIVGDNIDRFPLHLRDRPNTARKLLESDVSELAERVRRNYRLAVPQYYRGAVQLLLPLDLGAAPGQQELALVIERSESGARRAGTVIGNDLAYRQARVVARPDPGWLGAAWMAADDGAPAEAEGDNGVSASTEPGEASPW